MIDKWSPALTISTLLISIQALLSAPNPDDPLANDVASVWKSNEQGAMRTGAFACACSRRFRSFLSTHVCLFSAAEWTARFARA